MIAQLQYMMAEYMIADFPHQPVLLTKVLEYLPVGENLQVMDATYGDGHYSAALLQKGATVYAFDKDPEAIEKGAIEKAQLAKQQDAPKLHLFQADFADCAAHLHEVGCDSLDAMIFDLGVSSRQLDDAARGFSFRHDGVLDMRMAKHGKTAADIVNGYDMGQLARILSRGGEQKFARLIAKTIVRAREQAMIERTKQLADMISNAIPRHLQKREIHPATLSFQAIRIEVNQEFTAIDNALKAADNLLRKGGRLILVSFHSLEDRIIMRHLRREQGVSRHMPEREIEHDYRVLTKKAITPSDDEIQKNPRARSAKMRVAEKC